MGDKKEEGLQNKFSIIERADGESAPGGRHFQCNYFALDLAHDPFAHAAIQAYADACEKEGYVNLAADLRKIPPAAKREA